MARKPYLYTLWRERTGFFTGGTSSIVNGLRSWFDLQNEASMIEAVADLITRNGGHESDIEQYRLEILDEATGEQVTIISPSAADLRAVREGLRSSTTSSPKESSEVTHLENVSDEVLVRELLRRLRNANRPV